MYVTLDKVNYRTLDKTFFLKKKQDIKGLCGS